MMDEKYLIAIEENIEQYRKESFTIRDKQALDLIKALRAERQKVAELEVELRASKKRDTIRE